MLPRTAHGLEGFELISAIQKCIRRGLEREAMIYALEMANVNKQQFSMLLNRLRIIAHEDIGLADREAVMFTELACARMYETYPKQWRLPLANVILTLARASKSREADHFLAVCLQHVEDGNIPEIPDAARDMHTRRGRQMGRGIEHFLTEGTLLSPDSGQDAYREEAHAVLRLRAGRKFDQGPAARPGKPDDDEFEQSGHLF